MKKTKLQSALCRYVLLFLVLTALFCQSAAQGMQRPEDQSTAASSGDDSKDSKTGGSGSGKGDSDEPNHDEVDYQVTFFESAVLEVIFCGELQENLFAITDDGYIYTSDDHGYKWLNLTKAIMKTSKNPEINQFIQSPMDSQVVLLMGVAGQNYITEDCGKTIKKIDSAKPFHQFQFHPLNRDWLLAAAWTDCDEDDDPDDCSRFKELYVSKDLGANWQFVEEYVLQFNWGLEGVMQSITLPEQRIIISHITKKEGHQAEDGWVKNAEIAMSDDFFKTKTVLVPNANKFLLSDHFMFAVQVLSEKTQDIRLLVADARDTEHPYKFYPIELSNRIAKLKQGTYSLLDWGEDRVFLHVNHGDSDSKFGTMYISDSTGVRYTPSLKTHVKSGSADADFVKVEGLNGIYLANVYNPAAVKIASKEGWLTKRREISVEKASGKPTGRPKIGSAASSSDSEKQGKIIKDLDNHIMTMISFNRGSTWSKLTPPVKDADGEAIDCEGECSLHLASWSSGDYIPPYSSENSLGIVLGVGNVGKSLSQKVDELNTYFSRDGGLTWFEIIKGPHTFEIGDHGALIVVAPLEKATKSVFYTWDEGLSWKRLEFSDKPVEVSDIIIEPNNTSDKFLLLGTTTITGEKGAVKGRKGVAAVLDFSGLHERPCEGYWDAFNKPEGTDYELWTPNGKVSPDCLLGVKMTYVRRRRDAQCYNPEMFEFMSSYETCACTEDDWECDFGYERDSSNQCVRSNKTKTDIVTIPDDCNDFYYVSQGYRLIAGDYCVGGVDHAPLKLMCPRKLITRSTVLTVLIGVIAVLVWFAFGPKIRAFITGKAEEKKRRSGLSAKERFHQLKDFSSKLGNEDDEEYDNRIKFDDNDSKRPAASNNGASNGKSPQKDLLSSDDDDE